MYNQIIIVWFKTDLRIADNPALFEAAKHSAIMPIYILDDHTPSNFKIGSASRWWLHHSLSALNKSLGGKLNVYVGKSLDVILQIAKSYNVRGVYWNRCYEPFWIWEEKIIASQLKAIGVESRSFNGSLLWAPSEILKDDNTWYKVYAPFYNKLKSRSSPRVVLPVPKKLSLACDLKNTMTIKALGLLPHKNWYFTLEQHWDIGELAAQKKLENFLNKHLLGYKSCRDYPDKPNTSKLSPHLRFGEISLNQVWFRIRDWALANNCAEDAEWFLREICWREFSYYLLYHFPDMPNKNFNNSFDNFKWSNDKNLLKLWQKGRTGYPIIDAGMRELWQTGYMHNRVRMIVASFLVKNLLIHWHHGENWFWDCLVDADLANNSMNWQWVAGCGVDSSPYFRIFNPVLQGEKFDSDGAYTRKFVPELYSLPNKFLFKPWEAPKEVLESAGVVLGVNYPNPIVSLPESRIKALRAFKCLRQ